MKCHKGKYRWIFMTYYNNYLKLITTYNLNS